MQLREVGNCLREHAIDRGRERAQRSNCSQGQQDEKERVLRQILAFLFFPQANHKVLHLVFPLSRFKS